MGAELGNSFAGHTRVVTGSRTTVAMVTRNEPRLTPFLRKSKTAWAILARMGSHQNDPQVVVIADQRVASEVAGSNCGVRYTSFSLDRGGRLAIPELVPDPRK